MTVGIVLFGLLNLVLFTWHSDYGFADVMFDVRCWMNDTGSIALLRAVPVPVCTDKI